MKLKVIFFFLLFLSVSSAARAEEPSSLLRDVSSKLSLLESKLSRLSETQNEILKKHEAIDQELDSLRIWIRRNRK